MRAFFPFKIIVIFIFCFQQLSDAQLITASDTILSLLGLFIQRAEMNSRSDHRPQIRRGRRRPITANRPPIPQADWSSIPLQAPPTIMARRSAVTERKRRKTRQKRQRLKLAVFLTTFKVGISNGSSADFLFIYFLKIVV